jgi:hypothetical protein
MGMNYVDLLEDTEHKKIRFPVQNPGPTNPHNTPKE